MGTISQDLSAAGMTAAIEASWTGAFEQWGGSPRVQVHEEVRDLRWYVTPGVPLAIFNHAYHTGLAREEDIDARIDEVLDGFAGRGVPFMWTVGPFDRPADLGERLESRGLSRVEEMPGMAVDLTAIKEGGSSSSAPAVERVGDEGALRECIEVQRVGFEMPGFASEVLFDVCAAAGLGEESPWRFYVCRPEGKAVAASTLAMAGGVAGIYSVATLTEARRQGLGAAVTLAALREARELGYRIGVLQSSAMGYGVYRRLGFEQYSTYAIHVGTRQE
jgi:ribosomal protein S18 acetylase RimI-like enzyme